MWKQDAAQNEADTGALADQFSGPAREWPAFERFYPFLQYLIKPSGRRQRARRRQAARCSMSARSIRKDALWESPSCRLIVLWADGRHAGTRPQYARDSDGRHAIEIVSDFPKRSSVFSTAMTPPTLTSISPTIMLPGMQVTFTGRERIWRKHRARMEECCSNRLPSNCLD